MTVRAVHFRAGFCGTRTRRVVECDKCHRQIPQLQLARSKWLIYSVGNTDLKHRCPRCLKKKGGGE